MKALGYTLINLPIVTVVSALFYFVGLLPTLIILGLTLAAFACISVGSFLVEKSKIRGNNGFN